MPERLATLLADRLAAVGFECDHLFMEVVSGRVYRRGKSEMMHLPTRFAEVETLWPSATCLFGMGASVTDFLTAGVSVDEGARNECALLGGIANTLFGLFDWLLDSGRETPKLFEPGRHTDAHSQHRPGTHQELAASLLDAYIDKLQSISSAKPEIAQLTLRTLKKLYLAEMRSTCANGIGYSVWWRKSALPICVLGVPAWISPAEDGRIRFAEHLCWLARTGEFTGCVDDFADYEDDCRTGHVNRLKALERDSILRFAARVAEDGRQVLRFWDSHNDNAAARNTFMVMIWSWLTFDRRKQCEASTGSGS